MALREDERDRCDGGDNDPCCAEYYPCSLCHGSGKVSDGYEDWPCGACGATGCGYACVCGCDEED